MENRYSGSNLCPKCFEIDGKTITAGSFRHNIFSSAKYQSVLVINFAQILKLIFIDSTIICKVGPVSVPIVQFLQTHEVTC